MRPDDLIRWYEATRDNVSAPSIDLVRATGLVYAKRCGAERKGPPLSRKARMAGAKVPKPKICTARIRHWSAAERQWVCGQCGSAWRFWERRSLRGEIQETGTRQDGAERRLQRLVDVGLAIQRLLGDPRWAWEALLYVQHARGLSYADLAAAGARGDLGPEAPFTWGWKTVRTRVQAGGREWRRILKEAAIQTDD